ncbi:MAG: hypothetical protein IIC18_06375 [Bacteroidetes bacterium]|nr:hypothetical protein [Bacteroidota bacterium]
MPPPLPVLGVALNPVGDILAAVRCIDIVEVLYPVEYRLLIEVARRPAFAARLAFFLFTGSSGGLRLRASR